MSEENVEQIREGLTGLVEWFNSDEREPERFAEFAEKFAAPDVIYEEDPVWPDAGTFRGRDALVRRFLEYIDILQIGRAELGAIRDAGDMVLVELRMSFLAEGAGTALEFLWTYTARFDEEGRVSHWRAWFDQKQALKAAGLPE